MSLEVTVVCDGCSVIIAAASTGRGARRIARDECKAVVALPGGRDLCDECKEHRDA